MHRITEARKRIQNPGLKLYLPLLHLEWDMIGPSPHLPLPNFL